MAGGEETVHGKRWKELEASKRALEKQSPARGWLTSAMRQRCVPPPVFSGIHIWEHCCLSSVQLQQGERLFSVPTDPNLTSVRQSSDQMRTGVNEVTEMSWHCHLTLLHGPILWQESRNCLGGGAAAAALPAALSACWIHELKWHM